MGGSDPQNVATRVLEAIEQVQMELEVTVVSGSSNLHDETLATAVGRSRHRCRLLKNVQNMQELMSWADLAVSAAGSICWEYCAMGLPALLVAVAENQVANASALAAAGVARVLPGESRFSLEEMSATLAQMVDSSAERQALADRASEIVDAQGAPQVVMALSQTCAEPHR
jgi:spore coat polysaccharide biosynthesis predicted glycosyltransferase SpsG